MHTKLDAQIRKVLLGIMLGGIVLSLCFGVSGSPFARAQEAGTPELAEVNTEKLSDGTLIDELIINGPPAPPPGFEIQRQAVSLPAPKSVANINVLTVPAFNWVLGGSAVSGAMIAGYYDRSGWPNMYTGPTNGGVMPLDNSSWPIWSDGYSTYRANPLVASKNGVDGRTTRGSIDDYWVSYGSTALDPYITNGWTPHTWGDAIGDYMKTSQSAFGSSDGVTRFWLVDSSASRLTCDYMASYALPDGTLGIKLFYEARGYAVTNCYNQHTDNIIPGGFSFAQFKAEIDAGRPVMLSLFDPAFNDGLSVVGVGYDDASHLIYIHDTWDYSNHTMIWGGSYSGYTLLFASIVNIQGTIPYVLTVNKTGSGSGTVTSSPAGINCGTACSASFDYNTFVILTPTPATDSTFTGWSGACTGTDSCVVAMTAAKSVTANFTLSPSYYVLTVSKTGAGSGTVTSSPAGINCGTTCSASFNANTSVTLAATPATGSTFTGWSGACSGTGVCTVTMDAAKSVTATFILSSSYYVLTVSKAGAGSGTVTSSPAGINCGTTCSASFNANTSVTLAATPATGSTFTGWSGACSGTGACAVVMNANKSVTANFGPPLTNAVILTLSDGSGTPGSTGNRVTISADNQTAITTPIASAQFVVIYDSTIGITLSGVNPVSRASGFNASFLLDSTNPAAVKATILLYNMSGQTIASGAGPILDLLFGVNSSATPGATSTLTFSSALLSDAAGYPIVVDYRDTGIFTILSPCACGDVNCDGAVNVFDLQRLLNMILHTPQPDSTLYSLDQWTRADLTGDGQWNVFDLQRLLNCILGRGCVCAAPSVPARSAISSRQPAGTNVISLPDVTAQPGLSSGSFDIGLDNQDTVAASEIHFIYSSTVGLNVTGVRVAPRTTGFITSFTLDTSNPARTEVKVLLYNMSGLTLAPGSGPIVVIDYTLAPTATGSTPLSLTQALLSDSSGSSLPVTPVNGSFVIGTPNTYTLTVSKTGSGSGMVTSSPAGIDCGSDCSEIYAYNTSVTLTATPDTGSTFAGWSGEGCSGTGACTVTMDAAKSVTANFTLTLNTYTLTVSKTGAGSGMVIVVYGTGTVLLPGTAQLPAQITNIAPGTVITLTAIPGAASVFDGWSGAVVTTANPLVLTMDADQAVTATFNLYYRLWLPIVFNN